MYLNKLCEASRHPKCEQSPYHDGVGEVSVCLALQAHGAELCGHIALGCGLVQGGLLDASHLGDHKEGQHTLQGGRGNDAIEGQTLIRINCICVAQLNTLISFIIFRHKTR